MPSRSSQEVWRGPLWQPERQRYRRWLRQDVAAKAHGGPVSLAVEGCTGWRYVVEEITAAGFQAHLAEPADTQAARGRKRHAKTDRSDSRLLRELLQTGDLPESWIPPESVTVDSSGRRRANGYLSRQGPETLRWALYEAAKNSSHHPSPNHAYYAAVKERQDGKLAAISVARQLAGRCYHTLRAVPPDKVYAIPA